MKKILITTISLIFLLSCKSRNLIKDLNKNVYKVTKIDSVGKVYLFYLKRNDSLFKVMSKKEKDKKLTEIKIGKSYKFKLDSYFLPEELHIKQRVTGVKFNEELILLERDSIVSDLFMSKNIISKFYLK